MSNRRIISSNHATSPLGLRIFPSLCLLFLTILSLIYLPVPGIILSNPAFALTGIFYFTLWQPRYLPAAAVFACGLVYDAFQSSLFGTHALLFLLFRLSIARIRLHTGFVESIILNWGYFIVATCAYFLAEWLLVSLQSEFHAPHQVLLERDLSTLLIYPVCYLIFSSIITSLQSRG